MEAEHSSLWLKGVLLMSGRADFQAGTKPKRTPERSDTRAVKGRMLLFSLKAAPASMSGGTKTRSGNGAVSAYGRAVLAEVVPRSQ